MMYTRQQVTHALLSRPVLPAGAQAFERVTAAIAVRAALGARASERTVLFLVPEANQSTALHLGASLLVGNHAHANGGHLLPADEVRQLFKGDVLLVTQAVSETKTALEKLQIGQYQRLTDLWEVVPLTRYTGGRQTNRPRVCLANPGWALASIAGRRFGAVVIDASHPRTLAELPALARATAGCSRIRLIVAPPVSQDVLQGCGYPSQATVWLWDRQAQADAVLLTDSPPAIAGDGTRTVFVTEDDPEAATCLQALHGQLAAILRQADGRLYPGFGVAWSIYLRLRGLTVPLSELNQAAAHTWSGSLHRRMDELQSVEGYGRPLWDSTWPALCKLLRSAYDVFLRRREPAKYWALAARLEALLKGKEPVRVVCLSEVEAELLQRECVELLDDAVTAIEEGRLEFVSPGQEARLVAAGSTCHTVLLAPRPNRYRYLDVCPTHPVDVIAYPYEAQSERSAFFRSASYEQGLSGTEARLAFLAQLGLRPPASGTGAPVARGEGGFLVVSATTGRPVEVTADSETATTLDLEALAGSREARELVGLGGRGDHAPGQTGPYVEVTFSGGSIERFADTYLVDVFFYESEKIERVPVTELQAGWHVITFVDGRYDTLFKRLVETVEERLSAQERIAVEMWRKAKQSLAARHPNRTELHHRLEMEGCKVSYSVLVSCLREGEEQQLAPQRFEEFEPIAKLAGIPPQLIPKTFAHIQRTRGRNRVVGRRLRAFLRAVVSDGDSLEALESARTFDAALGDLLAAVEVREVASTRRFERQAD